MSEQFKLENINVSTEKTEASELRERLASMVSDPKNKKLLDLTYELWFKEAA